MNCSLLQVKTTHERLARAASLLAEAFAELERADGLEPIERGALLELRADVGQAIRRARALLVFTRGSER